MKIILKSKIIEATITKTVFFDKIVVFPYLVRYYLRFIQLMYTKT